MKLKKTNGKLTLQDCSKHNSEKINLLELRLQALEKQHREKYDKKPNGKPKDDTT